MTTELQTQRDDEVSLFAVGSTVLVHRWRILTFALLGTILAIVPVLVRGRAWSSQAAFVPEGVDASQNALKSLAGQFGVAVPATPGSTTQGAEFYVDLLSSRAVLGPIVAETVKVAETGGQPRAVADLLDIDASNPVEVREQGIEALREAIRPSFSRTTQIVRVTVTTEWPSVSQAIADRLLAGVNRFNLESRQSRASEERQFVEKRLEAARRSLAEAEGRMATFLQTNRRFDGSPELTFKSEGLQREVALHQQVLVGLAQSYEEVRMREVRDVPVITVIETPNLPIQPNRRGLLVRGAIGLLLGAFAGTLIALVRDMIARRRQAADPDAERFFALLHQAGRSRQKQTM